LTISRSVLVRMRNVSDKICGENQKQILSLITVFANRAVCEIMWENIVEPGRPQMTTWRMRISCWMTKATDTLEYVIVTVFPLQQWLK